MGTPFMGELRVFAFNFAPRGWALCNGQLLLINQNQALFSLLGTTYGGNGQTNFALPDLRGCAPLHRGTGVMGERAGEASHTLSQSEMPQHGHQVFASNNVPTLNTPGGNVPGNAPTELYHAPTNLVALKATSIANVGGSQPHNNMQPYVALNFGIALQGIFPSRN